MKILIIEDDELVRKSLELLLSRRGHTLFMYENGDGAQKYAEDLNPDLIITDHNLGKGDKGLKIASSLIKRGHKVILTSGENEIRGASLDMGIPFILKGNPNELLEMVDNISRQITT